MLLSNLKIATKSLLPVAIMAIFSLIISWFGATSADNINAANNNALYASQRAVKAEEISSHVLAIGRARYRAIASPDESVLLDARDQVKARMTSITALTQQLPATLDQLIKQSPILFTKSLQAKSERIAFALTSANISQIEHG